MAMLVENKRAETPAESLSRRSLVSLCKAAADPLRVDILRVLSRDSFGVQELASIFSVPQPGMSHHLKILFQSGLLVTRRQGNSIFYRRPLLPGNSGLDAFQSQLYGTIDAVPLDEKYARKISAVYKERSRHSREYFERNADRFEENQGLLCELTQYLPNLAELLDLMKVAKKARAMEVGPGSGELLATLGQRFAHVTALDDSAEMLELARKKAKGKNLEFVNDSLETYPAPGPAFDAVILNMVLHHMPSPAKAFRKLAQLTTAQGYVLVADLCSHNQQWAKESCGDTWLGFDPQEINDWATDAGFREEQSSYLGLKNGFQIQLKLFRKIS